MNKRANTSRKSSGNWWAVLSSLSIVLLSATVYFSNVGCEFSDQLTAFKIVFSPAYYFVSAPGSQGTVSASIDWADDRAVEADWTLLPGRPPIVKSVSLSGASKSVVTEIDMTFADDPALFEPSDLYVASKATAYQVGVRAAFVDPTWKSVTGGNEEGRRVRKGFLSLRSGFPKVTVTPTGVYDTEVGTLASFQIDVENSFEGWSYKVRAYHKEIHKVEGSVTNYVSYETTINHGDGPRSFPQTGLNAEASDESYASYNVFEIEYRSGSGIGKKERKVFKY